MQSRGRRLSRNKYGAVRTEYRGEWYDSKMEANYAARLDLEKRAGKILNWWRGERVDLLGSPGRPGRVTYKPDFHVVYPDGQEVAIDVKGAVPRDFRIRVALWELKFPNLPLRVVDKDGNVCWPKKRRPVISRASSSLAASTSKASDS